MIKFLIALVVFLGLTVFFHLHDQNQFTQENFLADFPHIENTPLLDEQTCGRLNQQFTFLGKGAQVYAFLGEDGKTVLKLFKAHHVRPFNLRKLFREKKDPHQRAEKWHKKFEATCSRYLLAFEKFRKESALLGLHFSKDALPKCSARFKESSGKIFSLPLENHPFIVQEKVELVPIYFKQLLAMGEKEELYRAIEKLRTFLTEKAKLGLVDPHQCFHINYGFVRGEPIQLDVGKLKMDPKTQENPAAEIARVHKNLNAWLKKHFAQHFDDKLKDDKKSE